jgi:hypothetical protein
MAKGILKIPPPFLFRYRSPGQVENGFVEDVLRENRIWASPPRNFKDPYDCTARIDFEGTKSEYLRHWNRQFKMLRFKGKARSRAASEAVATGAWKDPAKNDQIRAGMQANLDKSGVICLTDTPLDHRMWEEYADSHRGICLCFETSESPFSFTLECSYTTSLPIVRFDADGDEQIRAFLLTKGDSYSWEREWRFVDFMKGGGHKPISPTTLRAIVLGKDAEKATREAVFLMVAQRKPDVMIFVVRDTGADLRLQPIDLPLPSRTRLVTPPILVRPTHDPLERSKADLLRQHLVSIAISHRQAPLDGRIAALATRLTAMEATGGKPSLEAAAGATAAAREARDLLRDVVHRTGTAIPGYENIAVFLYRLVHAVVIKPGYQI